MSKTVAEVVAELEPLSVEDIRAKFKTEGVQGERMNPCACPVARYVARKLGAKFVRAYPLAGIWVEEEAEENFVCLYAPKEGAVPTPVSVQLFIGAFDQGLFPELIERKS